mmetsp:Transcript_494/g.1012  ORF Transcript_494/g.1012 Transcript_494/m.1012 type:complete len:267 (-) Transcript_494:81-881(-)
MILSFNSRHPTNKTVLSIAPSYCIVALRRHQLHLLLALRALPRSILTPPLESSSVLCWAGLMLALLILGVTAGRVDVARLRRVNERLVHQLVHLILLAGPVAGLDELHRETLPALVHLRCFPRRVALALLDLLCCLLLSQPCHGLFCDRPPYLCLLVPDSAVLLNLTPELRRALGPKLFVCHNLLFPLLLILNPQLVHLLLVQKDLFSSLSWRHHGSNPPRIHRILPGTTRFHFVGRSAHVSHKGRRWESFVQTLCNRPARTLHAC